MLLTDQWNDTTIQKGPEDARYNDVWGFEANESNYCVIGSTFGTHFFEVKKNGLNYLFAKEGLYSSPTVIHRDFKTYRNYLYAVCDEGSSGLQVFDLQYLPDSVSTVYASTSEFTICHNIYIDTVKARLYACGPDNIGMKIFDLSDPENPSLILNFTTVNYVHDCYVRNDTAFLNCGFDGLHVYDFGEVVPMQLGILDFYPQQGYNHSGWLSPDGSNYAFIDETEGTKIKLCEINNLSQIQIDQQFGSASFTDNVPHNVFLLNRLAFIAYYNEGLRIFDTGLSPVKEIGAYDTFDPDTPYKLNGAWGVYVFPDMDQILVSDRQNGLFLFSFPVHVLDQSSSGTFVTSSPFIDENSILIPRDLLTTSDLYFGISTIDGKVIYEQESYLNWVGIPVDIAPGIYIYSIFSSDRQLLESGKFAKAN